MTNLFTKRIPFLVSMFGDNWSRFYFDNRDQASLFQYSIKRDNRVMEKCINTGNPLKRKSNG